jgi:prostaglandin reductase 1
LENLPLSYALGVLGMPGAAAYFGLNHLCNPKEGQTVLVNAAAGAVGSTVGQLAKLRGCKVIASVGSSEKLTWCADSLKFDHVFNYKNVDLNQELERYCSNGVDIFFDNVGGDFFHTVVNKFMKTHGKISLCGSISTYCEEKPKLCEF